MDENKPYRCVNCGEAVAALYRTYGPSVLKLTKCVSCFKYILLQNFRRQKKAIHEKQKMGIRTVYTSKNSKLPERCKGVVDKYIEYDPVIVMIDLVLMSKEAQRHVIYNTEFKSYWKLFIILLILETFSLWRNDSLFNMTINTICNGTNTYNETYINLPVNITLPESWSVYCKGWNQPERESVDLFIWEKDFYVQFLATFSGVLMYILVSHLMMTSLTLHTAKSKVGLQRLTKSHSLSYAHALAALPALVWARDARGPQQAAALLYAGVASYNVLREHRTLSNECLNSAEFFYL